MRKKQASETEHYARRDLTRTKPGGGVRSVTVCYQLAFIPLIAEYIAERQTYLKRFLTVTHLQIGKIIKRHGAVVAVIYFV